MVSAELHCQVSDRRRSCNAREDLRSAARDGGRPGCERRLCWRRKSSDPAPRRPRAAQRRAAAEACRHHEKCERTEARAQACLATAQTGGAPSLKGRCDKRASKPRTRSARGFFASGPSASGATPPAARAER
ncbi:MAG: hypothetical protein MZV70_46880 [Desulfobacterales bacterium]|nr:hypothetical protein [Desulfobacterales bacterium]